MPTPGFLGAAPRFAHGRRRSRVEECRAQLVPLDRGPVFLRNGRQLGQRFGRRQRSRFRRGELASVDAHLVDAAVEAVVEAPAPAHLERRVALARPVQVVEQHADFPLLAVDVHADALGLAIAVVGQEHVLPPPALDVPLRLEADAEVGPALRHVPPELAAPHEQPPAAADGILAHRGDDGPVLAALRIDPCRDAQRVQVVVDAHLAQIGVVGPVEQACRSAPALGELRLRRLGLAVAVDRAAGPEIDAHPTVERGMRREPAARSPVRLRRAGQPGLPHRLLPRNPGFHRLPAMLRSGQLVLESREPFLLPGQRRSDQRVLVAEVPDHALFGHVVEVREELVVLLLRKGVELVVVAAGASERQAQPDRRCRLRPVRDVLDAELLVHRAALGGGAVVAVESGCDDLVARRSGQHVSCQLLERESIER